VSKHRRAMANPFAGIATAEPSPATEPTTPIPTAGIAAVPGPVIASPEAREFVGFRLPSGLLDRARAVAWTHRLTVTALVEDALTKAVQAAEQAHGGPLPPVMRRRRSR
jgi:hypothetical protein